MDQETPNHENPNEMIIENQNTYCCKRCNTKILSKNRDIHELYCAYSLHKDELKDLIPCEFCNSLIQFDAYHHHIRYCELFIDPQNMNRLNDRNTNTNREYNNNNTYRVVIPFENDDLENNNADNGDNTNRENNGNTGDSENNDNTGDSENNDNNTANTDNRINSNSNNRLLSSLLTEFNRYRDQDIENDGHSQTIIPIPQSIFIPTTQPILNVPATNVQTPSPTTTNQSSSNPYEDTSNSNQTNRPQNTNGNIPTEENVLLHNNDNEDDIDNNEGGTNNEDPFESNIRTFISFTIDNVIENTINRMNYYTNPVYYNNNVYEPMGNYEYLTELGNRIGVVDKGIKNIDAIAPKQTVADEIKCPICMEKTKDIRLTICNHSYCSHCIEKWLEKNKKCPVCMKEFSEPLDNEPPIHHQNVNNHLVNNENDMYADE